MCCALAPRQLWGLATITDGVACRQSRKMTFQLRTCSSAFEFQLFTCVDHTPGNFLTSHAASAELTSTGFSCAIRWPLFTTTSVRSEQWARIGSARREVTVSQV